MYFRAETLKNSGHRNTFRNNQVLDNGDASSGYGFYILLLPAMVIGKRLELPKRARGAAASGFRRPPSVPVQARSYTNTMSVGALTQPDDVGWRLPVGRDRRMLGNFSFLASVSVDPPDRAYGMRLVELPRQRHIDVSYINISGMFATCAAFSMPVMTEADIEIILQAAKEKYPEVRPGSSPRATIRSRTSRSSFGSRA